MKSMLKRLWKTFYQKMNKKIPKDIGLKIATKREAWWISIKEKAEESILNAEEGLIADRNLIELAEEIIQEEQRN